MLGSSNIEDTWGTLTTLWPKNSFITKHVNLNFNLNLFCSHPKQQDLQEFLNNTQELAIFLERLGKFMTTFHFAGPALNEH